MSRLTMTLIALALTLTGTTGCWLLARRLGWLP